MEVDKSLETAFNIMKNQTSTNYGLNINQI